MNPTFFILPASLGGLHFPEDSLSERIPRGWGGGGGYKGISVIITGLQDWSN